MPAGRAGGLLKQLLALVPGVEAYGVEASADMLVQARVALQGQQHAHLERAQIGTGGTANLPYAQETFDLITCTNALHDIPESAGTLAGLRRLLAPGGQLVVEDLAQRELLFLWAAFEWLLRRIEGGTVRTYSLAEAQALCQQAGLYVASGRVFTVDWLWHGWAIRAYRVASEARPA